jgi:hypothetical protein
VTLLIALLGDLPDAQSSGVVGSIATGLITARAVPQVGLYMETLGAAVLIVACVAGLLLGVSKAPAPLTSGRPTSLSPP